MHLLYRPDDILCIDKFLQIKVWTKDKRFRFFYKNISIIYNFLIRASLAQTECRFPVNVLFTNNPTQQDLGFTSEIFDKFISFSNDTARLVIILVIKVIIY